MLELTVALMLTGIVVLMAYSAYSVVQRQWVQFETSRKNMLDVAMLDMALHRDLSNSRETLKTTAGITCRFPDGRFVHYVFSGNEILRNATIRTDTFRIVTENVSFRFKNTEQYIPGKPLDAITFRGKLQEEWLPFAYAKLYGAAQLIKWEETAEHAN